MNKTEKVMIFGTFDVFHPGHRYFLRQARKKGEYLIVVVARDKTIQNVKKKKPFQLENERKKIIEDSGLADEVVLGGLEDKYEVIKNIKPDKICLGYDQKFFINNLKDKINEFRMEKTKIYRLKSYKPEIYKSSKIKNKM